MIRLFFSFNGKRGIMEVPFSEASKINRKLFLKGVAVYWSERV